MEEKAFCQACKSHQVARSYPSEKDPKVLEFYCLECYSRLFLDGGDEEDLRACPHCGMSLAEVRAGKLVGCMHCYQAMWSGIFPLVEKMQGVRAHQGKTPPAEDEEPSFYDSGKTPQKRASEKKQQHELFILSQKLRQEGDEEGARYYEEKLSAIKRGEEIEEDFECRTRRNLSKQS